MIKTALVGFGKSAKIFHLPFLRILPEYEIAAFVSSKPELIKQEYPQARTYADVMELARDNEIDLVIINSPTFLHYEQARLFLQAGKHVVVEKPFVVRAEEAEELVALAASNNLKLSVYHNRRWDSGYLTLKRLLKENVLGEIHHYEIHYDRWRPRVQDRWKESDQAGSGILYDLGSHLIDQALQLFGEPDEILSDTQAQRPGAEAIDYFHVVFKYGKMRAILHASSLVQAPPNHLVAHGTRASFVCSAIDPQEDALTQGLNYDQIADWGESKLVTVVDGKIYEQIIEPEKSSYQKFYEELAAAIKHNAPLPVEPESVVDTIKIIESLSNNLSYKVIH